MKKRKKKTFSRVKTVREISRQKIGTPRAVHVLQGKKDKLLERARKLDVETDT